MHSGANWREKFIDGSPEAERRLFIELARDILDVQLANKKKGKASEVQRAFHAKAVLGVTNAKLAVLSDIPERFRVGYFRPGAEYQAVVRLSNANGNRQADYKRDMRGAAVRITVSDDEHHDLLMTNFPVSHARDARQFVAFAKAMSGSKLLLFPRLIFDVGPFEMIRMLRNVTRGARVVDSLALETYWSRGAILWGDTPVRYLLRPAANAPRAPEASRWDADFLHHEIANRLRRGDITFDLLVQSFVDERHTPIEGRVLVTELSGSESIVHFDLNGGTWVSQSHGIHPFEVGSTARLYVDVDEGFFFDEEGRLIAGGALG